VDVGRTHTRHVRAQPDRRMNRQRLYDWLDSDQAVIVTILLVLVLL
jgi:hypothetical protein